MSSLPMHRIALAAIVLGLTGCGGGGGTDPGAAPDGSATPTALAAAVPTEKRIAAATATAQSATNGCAAIRPFYWEIGDSGARLAGGPVDSSTDRTRYAADTTMSIASASKWLYAAYVVQRQSGNLSKSDVKALGFLSGYSSFSGCLPNQTVDACVAFQDNGVHSDFTDGRFYYGGGHMQVHAQSLGLGALGNLGLAAEVRSQIGADIAMTYSQPQPAGGVVSSADDYARFLRKLLDGSLRMRDALGTHPVCTNPKTCPAGQAVYTPIPTSESWHYAVGHWIEDDPVVGDGSFSSPGAFGFYPWIDASRTLYGIVARRDETAGGFESVQCGRLVRKAWLSATPQ